MANACLAHWAFGLSRDWKFSAPRRIASKRRRSVLTAPYSTGRERRAPVEVHQDRDVSCGRTDASEGPGPSAADSAANAVSHLLIEGEGRAGRLLAALREPRGRHRAATRKTSTS